MATPADNEVMKYKVILAGDRGVGKSVLRKKLKEGAREQELDSNVLCGKIKILPDERVEGKDSDLFHVTLSNGDEMTVELFSIVNMETYGIDNVPANFFNGVHGVMLVCKYSETSTMYNLDDWFARINDGCVCSLWQMKETFGYGPESLQRLKICCNNLNVLEELGFIVSSETRSCDIVLNFLKLVAKIHEQKKPNDNTTVDLNDQQLKKSRCRC